MRISARRRNRLVFWLLLGVCGVFASVVATAVPASDHRSTLALISNVCVVALVAQIAIPQVVAALSLREQARRVSCVIDGRFWVPLGMLLASVFACFIGTLLSDGGRLGSFWAPLLDLVGMDVLVKVTLVLAAASLTAFVAYLAWLLPNVSSANAVLAALSKRLRKVIAKGKRQEVREEISNLEAIGREASSAHTRAAVIKELVAAGTVALQSGDERMRIAVLTDVVQAMTTVVGGEVIGRELDTSLSAIKGLLTLLRQTRGTDFDADRFAAGICGISSVAVRRDSSSIALHGINALADIAERMADKHAPPRVGIARFSFHLDALAT